MPFPWYASQRAACLLDHPVQIVPGQAVMIKDHVENRVIQQVLEPWLRPASSHRAYSREGNQMGMHLRPIRLRR